jgi:S-adenosylmethionine:tRNA-ribosyltransferase-isomerase (queuine synthetase)
VTLHVGMGTFADVSEENVEKRKLHTEPISISQDQPYEKMREANKRRKEKNHSSGHYRYSHP